VANLRVRYQLHDRRCNDDGSTSESEKDVASCYNCAHEGTDGPGTNRVNGKIFIGWGDLKSNQNDTLDRKARIEEETDGNKNQIMFKMVFYSADEGACFGLAK
jgi:hypothetical protein